MKEKKLTITSKNISPKQWSALLLELNLVKEAWKKYGPNMDIKAKNFKRIVKWGKRKIGESEKE